MDNRPWYISFTAIWHQAQGFKELRSICRDLLDKIPFHHLPVKEEYWHFTVLPLLRANSCPSGTPAEEFIFGLLKRLDIGSLNKTINLPPLSVYAYQAIAFNSGTSIQFRGVGDCLSKLRDTFRDLAKARIATLVAECEGIISELDPPTKKNKGNETYGSLARALTPESNSIRWRREIEPQAILRFEKVHLVVSDEYLSNPYAHDDQRRISLSLPLK